MSTSSRNSRNSANFSSGRKSLNMNPRLSSTSLNRNSMTMRPRSTTVQTGSTGSPRRTTSIQEVACDPDRHGSGASFAESQLPSSGLLTVEADREVIKEIEEKVMDVDE
jgi:hypothetical protein